MNDPIFSNPYIKNQAPEIDRIKREDLSVTWVRYIRGGILGRYTEAVVTHPTLGQTKLLVALPMGKEAIAGWIETFVPKRLYREFVAKGVVYLGVPEEEVLVVRVTPHRWEVRLKGKDLRSQIATTYAQLRCNTKCRSYGYFVGPRWNKPRRLVKTLSTPPPPKPKGEWEGDPIRDRKQA